MKLNSFILILFSISLFNGCQLSGVDEENKAEENQFIQRNEQTEDTVNHNEKIDSLDQAKTLDDSTESLDEIEYDNGIIIKWISKGKGGKVESNQMVNIDYRNSLENGAIYDGNHLIKKPYVPFFVGWNQQTKGWDFALTKLREGDQVEVFLPAEWARGEKGIPGVVPPNAPNILYLDVKEILEPTFVVDDIRIWRVEKGKKPNDSISFEDELAIHYFVSSESNPRYDNSYERGEPFQLTMGDGNIVPGLYKALHFGRKGDKLMIHIPAKEAYGSDGLKGLVQPNEDLFYDLIIVDHKNK